MGRVIKEFWKNEQGATAIEYALIAGGIAIPLIGILTSIGSELRIPFQNVVAGFR